MVVDSCVNRNTGVGGIMDTELLHLGNIGLEREAFISSHSLLSVIGWTRVKFSAASSAL